MASTDTAQTLRHRPTASSSPPSPPPLRQHETRRQDRDNRPPQASAAAPACLGLAAALVLVAIVLRAATPPTKLWTKEELSMYNGSDGNQPILLSILGSVFDVTSGRQHYGPQGRYNYFAGRDASRGFITGDDADDSVQGLSFLQIKTIVDWRSFYHRSYVYKGKLVGRYYDAYGSPMEELRKVEKDAKHGDELLKKQEAEENEFPSCNSHWSEKDGGEVWCPVGYPRLVEKNSEYVIKEQVDKRCACFEKHQLPRPGLELYVGCPPLSKVCRTS